jgi:CO/xanthine dehydrogenase Mo-binding subunit
MTMTKLNAITLNRRDFIKAAGGLVVAINVPVYMQQVTAVAAGPNPFGPLTVPADQIGSWLAVGKDGIVTIGTGKVELGTGTLTATRQIVAEELDVAFEKTTIVQGITGQTVDQGTTAGSQTMRTQWATGLRISAASARQTLLGLAATKLGVSADKLTVSNGVVSAQGDSSKTVSYADLVGGAPITGTVNTKVKPKDSSTYKVVGQSIPREDVPAKVTGEFTYVQDVTLPGMLHGRVVRPTRPAPLNAAGTALATVIKGTLANATLGSVDESSIKHIPGAKVVTKNNFVGVVAAREEHAIAAAQALKVTWNDSASLPDQATLYDTIQNAKVDNTRILSDTGNVDTAIASAVKTLQAVYTHPYQAHASIGPSAAVANVHEGIAEVWSGTQAAYPLRRTLATLLNLDESSIRVNYVEGSGCYGINGADDVSLSAALLSQAVGKPVRVQYMRADEISWENYGNAMVMSLKAGLAASGHIVGWDYQNWSANRGGRPAPPANIPTGVLAGFPENPPPKSPPPSPPLGDDASNALPWYNFPSQRVRSYGVYRPWLFTGPLRSPARLQNTFAQESFMDELAAAAAADPVSFRLLHTGDDQRLIDVINAASKAANWQTRPSPAPAQSGTTKSGRGIAATRYEGNSSWVAAVVTVTVDTTAGTVTPTQVVASQDCGVVINPDGTKAQIEGNIVQGLSRSLKEEVNFDRSGVLSVDWASYPIITFKELPDDIKIVLVNRPSLPALGVGEAVISVIGAAISNAIFDATGKRMRQIPFTPERVKAALA